MQQIRGSDFIEQNPAHGKSIFDLSALAQLDEDEEFDLVPGVGGALEENADAGRRR